MNHEAGNEYGNCDSIEYYIRTIEVGLQRRRCGFRNYDAILIHEMALLYAKRRITRVETNPELEMNAKVHAQWKFFERRHHKRRRCYIRHLANPNEKVDEKKAD